MAGLLEFLSEGSKTLTSAEHCLSYDENRAQRLLKTEGQFCANCETPNPAQDDLRVIHSTLQKQARQQSAEDLYFAQLAEQHATELDCGADFAKQVAEGKIPPEDQQNLEARLEIARAARRQLLAASKRLRRPESNRKICPTNLDDLKANPLPKELSADDESCEQIIKSRLAIQSITNSLPLAGTPAVRALYERYINLPEGPEAKALQASLGSEIRKAYGEAQKQIQDEATSLRETLKTKGGSGFDRGARYALLSDPRVNEAVLRKNGGGQDIQGLACRADGRYGSGADTLDNVLMVGSFALSGGAAIAARAGSAGVKIAQGMNQARGAGLLSLNATRALQVSALAADSVSAYSQLEKECKLSIRAQSTDAGQCVSAPKVEQIGQDGCILETSLNVIGFGMVLADPAMTLLKKLKNTSSATAKSATDGKPLTELAEARRDESTEVATVGSRREDTSEASGSPKLARVAAPNARQVYTDKYLHISPTTPSENRAWIARAESPTDPANPTLFFEVENSKIQHLNNMTKDKNLVTAMTNRHKILLFDRIKELEKKYPGLTIERYSDFKSSRFAFSGKIPPNLQDDLAKIFKDANQDFTDEVLGQGKFATQTSIARKSDNPDQWFRAGCSDSVGWAYLATRKARAQVNGNVLRSCNDPQLRTEVEKAYNEVEAKRQRLESEITDNWIMNGPRGERELSATVAEMLRKSRTPEEVASKIASERGVQLTPEQSQLLFDYAAQADEFSPNLFIAERRIVNLDDAEYGGMSADFIGAGSLNQLATNSALRRAKNADEAIRLAREGERNVTKVFETRRQALHRVMGGDCSGDDCAEVFSRPLNAIEKKKRMDDIARNPNSRGVRIAMIPSKVPVEARSILSAHGESIARYVTQELTKIMPQNRLSKITIGVDMQTRQINRGRVKVIAGIDPRTPLTATEKRKINEALRRALNRFNRDQKNIYNTPSNYR